MKTLYAIVLTLALLATAALGQPVIKQVSNAASEALTPLPNSSIAQGSYFAIYGTGLGPATAVTWNPYPLPTSLGGVSIAVSVPTGSTAVAAYPEYVSSGQINAIMPSTVTPGTGTITVTFNSATSATFPVTVAASSFGAFSWNSAGTGPGIITDVNYVELNPFHTAKPGDYVILWGTGLGPAPDPSTEISAPPAVTNLCPGANCPTVWVGGVQTPNLAYAGRSGFTGEDQIVFQVPNGVQGCFVQVALQTGSTVGNFTSMAVDPNGAVCQDADGINVNDLLPAIQSKGSANVAAISLLSNYLNLTIQGIGTLPWDNDTVTGEIATFSTGVLELFQGFALAPSVNNCTVQPFLQYPPPTDPGLSYVTFLDAGASLSIQGPNGTASVPKNKNGNGYGALVGGETIADLIAGCPLSSTNACAPFFLSDSGWNTSSYAWAIAPGQITVSGPGGSAVGQFSENLTVSSAAASFKWDESTVGTSISRSSPLTITWTGGDPNGYVDITLISSTLASGVTPAATTPGILAECIAPNSAGSFTVPVYVLQSLPSTASSSALVPPGEILVGPASAPVKMTTPPTGLDAAYLFYHYIYGSNVTWN